MIVEKRSPQNDGYGKSRREQYPLPEVQIPDAVLVLPGWRFNRVGTVLGPFFRPKLGTTFNRESCSGLVGQIPKVFSCEQRNSMDHD